MDVAFLTLLAWNIPLCQALKGTDNKAIALLPCRKFPFADVAVTQLVVDFCSINESILKKLKNCSTLISRSLESLGNQPES
jgi:hypothetical protein